MCFAEPGRIAWTDGSIARVRTSTGESEVSLAVLRARGEQVSEGDWVVAALGLAIEHITEHDGRRLLDEHRALIEGARIEGAAVEGVGADVR